jgi:DNA-binding PadR family transcriptional regulator
MKEVASEAGGGVRMGPGTLYGSLDRMAAGGLVEETGVTDDERRRYYRLTLFGRKVLGAEAARLNLALASARKQRVLPTGGGA